MNLDIPIYDVAKIVRDHAGAAISRQASSGLPFAGLQSGIDLFEDLFHKALDTKSEFDMLDAKRRPSGDLLLPLKTGDALKRSIRADRKARQQALVLLRAILGQRHVDVRLIRDNPAALTHGRPERYRR